jgi:hypothetical protein
MNGGRVLRHAAFACRSVGNRCAARPGALRHGCPETNRARWECAVGALRHVLLSGRTRRAGRTLCREGGGGDRGCIGPPPRVGAPSAPPLCRPCTRTTTSPRSAWTSTAWPPTLSASSSPPRRGWTGRAPPTAAARPPDFASPTSTPRRSRGWCTGSLVPVAALWGHPLPTHRADAPASRPVPHVRIGHGRAVGRPPARRGRRGLPAFCVCLGECSGCEAAGSRCAQNGDAGWIDWATSSCPATRTYCAGVSPVGVASRAGARTGDRVTPASPWRWRGSWLPPRAGAGGRPGKEVSGARETVFK